MGSIRSSLICSIFIIVLIITSTAYAGRTLLKRQSSISLNERIDCYPENLSPFSNYSKESCLARNCLYDDEATANTSQCYLSPKYGYILQDRPIEIKNGLRLKLKRNAAVKSMFQQPIENVLLDVQYYTNDIIRFKLYDADQQRYEVRSSFCNTKILIDKSRFQYRSNHLLNKFHHLNMNLIIHQIHYKIIFSHFLLNVERIKRLYLIHHWVVLY